MRGSIDVHAAQSTCAIAFNKHYFTQIAKFVLGTLLVELRYGGDFTVDFLVSLDDEILARVRAAKVWDNDSKSEDFQIRAHANGLVLINLKTGRAQLLYDEDSDLRDWKELFPNLVLLPERETWR